MILRVIFLISDERLAEVVSSLVSGKNECKMVTRDESKTMSVSYSWEVMRQCFRLRCTPPFMFLAGPKGWRIYKIVLIFVWTAKLL